MVKREFARESPGILSRCQRVAGPSAFCFGPETDQRINDEPDILIRGGKFSREPEERFFFLKIAGMYEDRSTSLDNFVPRLFVDIFIFAFWEFLSGLLSSISKI